ncbi:MAG TPA: VWA domain-containing protein [Cellvibrio sp.]|mgnify:CR=1 FL=1|nr:VWA domain-containing protein [Cellvibrio sp.]
MLNRLFRILFFASCLVFAPWLQAQTQDAGKETSKDVTSAPTAAVSNAAKSATPVKQQDVKRDDSGKEDTSTQIGKPTKILPSDVRVLIDISGSMKLTDPQNLRKPAMDLIVRLLPDKSRAGVWTFGNTVNMLVPFKPVDADWRKQAAAKSNAINSIAMHTGIGKALDEVSFDKSGLSADYKTHIILLTDGVVDVDKDAVVNYKERQRILNEILPSLKAAGYTVHTIALSENSDLDLLKKLSHATDGVYTLAASADQLMSVFLKIFDQAVPAERVPLENNGFLVDASIKEFTALIFRKPGEEKTTISSPEGKDYSATNPNDGVNWYRTDKYDLITVDSPKPGQWKIKTEIAPQSRITVVSNLQLVFEPLKNNLHSKDVLALSYSFQENGKTITDSNFLGLIETNAIVVKNNTEENTNTSFTLPAPPADGFFHQNLNTFETIGDYEIHVYVDGKTFKREFKHSLSVRDSYMVLEKSSAVSEDGKLTYSYKISADEKVVDLSKTQVAVTIKNSQNNNVDKTLSLIDGKRWEFSFSPVQEGEYSVSVHAQGERFDGEKLDETLQADNFSYVVKKAAAASSVSAPVADAKHEEAKPEEAKPEAESNNLLLYISIAVGNLLLVALGYFAYKFIMGSKAKDELAEFEKTLSATGAKDVKDTSSLAQQATTRKAPDKTEIDLSDDDSAHIPMSDDGMDKLFPLDSMDDPNAPDDRN